MKTQNVVAIFGYNNSRIYDVNKIKDLVAKQCNAEILLIKESIDRQDLEVTPYCLDHRPEDPNISENLKSYLKEKSLNLVGCLPFSDKGVVGGAFAAKNLDLFGDDETSSFAMLDKSAFRQLEAAIQIDPTIYKKPFFELAHSASEIYSVLKTKGSFFIKPKAEGNSRGCMKIETEDDIARWLLENSACLNGGVICEEILSNENEYSFDGVAGAYWITQKFTTKGAYRAEYQHIIPAPLSKSVAEKVHSTLTPLLQKLGSRGGAFHHEFFLLNDGRVASVEPNRRPAGMWIWDLAAWAFDGYNPWVRWIDRCTNKPSNSTPLESTCFAGVRGVIANQSGCLSFINREKIEKELAERFGKENLKISFLKFENAQVRGIPRDNSDFLAFIALKNNVYEELVANLEIANGIFLKNIEVMS